MGRVTPLNEIKDRTYRVLRVLYDKMPDVGSPTDGSLTGDTLAEMVGGVKGNVIERHLSLFRHLGIIKMEITYPGRGRVAIWTLLVDLAEAYRLLDAHFATSREWTAPGRVKVRKVKPKVAKPTVPEASELVAVIGPDPEQPLAALAPVRKDEGAALVEAARQYRNRDRSVIEHLEAIEALGIKVDRAAAIAAIEMPGDERLDAVSDVLDYIDQLEREVTRAARHADERRNLIIENGTLKSQVQRLQTALTRQAERHAQEKVANGNAAQAEA